MKDVQNIKSEVIQFAKSFAVNSVGFSALLPGMEWRIKKTLLIE